MKRYMLFGFDTFYPSGGMSDFIGDFDKQEELDNLLKCEFSFKFWEDGRFESEIYEVYDVHEGVIIELEKDKTETKILNSIISRW